MIWSTRFKVEDAVSQRIIQNADGIRVAAVLTDDGLIVLLVDMGERNHGCSLTNCMETVINHVNRQFLQSAGIAFERAIWVQIDSEGDFDWVKPLTSDGGTCIDVSWRPLISAGGERSRNAFVMEYGGYAHALLKAVEDNPLESILATGRATGRRAL